MPKKKRTAFEECHFIGEGGEDIRDIIKKQFIRHVNEEKGFPYLGLKSEKNKGIEKEK